MTNAETMAAEITAVLPKIKSGTLRFWGVWFGKPYDNVHTMVACDADCGILRLHFNANETLSITEPVGLNFSVTTFKIESASCVRWQWFSYGMPKVAANLYTEEFIAVGDKITATSNVDWYKPNLEPTKTFPAVEIL